MWRKWNSDCRIIRLVAEAINKHSVIVRLSTTFRKLRDVMIEVISHHSAPNARFASLERPKGLTATKFI